MKVTMNAVDMYYCMHNFYIQHLIGLCYCFMNESQMSYTVKILSTYF